MVVAMLMAILLGLIFGCWVKPPNPELTLVGGGLVLLLFIDSAGNTDVPRCHEPLVRVVALGAGLVGVASFGPKRDSGEPPMTGGAPVPRRTRLLMIRGRVNIQNTRKSIGKTVKKELDITHSAHAERSIDLLYFFSHNIHLDLSSRSLILLEQMFFPSIVHSRSSCRPNAAWVDPQPGPARCPRPAADRAAVNRAAVSARFTRGARWMWWSVLLAGWSMFSTKST